jgi:hypothetical protein
LPREIRDELNHRLENGENSDSLLPWLNGLPAVQSVLTCHFSGAAVNKQNLSEWRARGFIEWQNRQAMLADARELAADSTELAATTEGRLADHLATVLTARYASTLAGWNGEFTEEFQQKLKLLRGMCQDTVAMRWGDYSGARLQMERERLAKSCEKTEDEVVAKFEAWAAIPAVPRNATVACAKSLACPPEPNSVPSPSNPLLPSEPPPHFRGLRVPADLGHETFDFRPASGGSR